MKVACATGDCFRAGLVWGGGGGGGGNELWSRCLAPAAVRTPSKSLPFLPSYQTFPFSIRKGHHSHQFLLSQNAAGLIPLYCTDEALARDWGLFLHSYLFIYFPIQILHFIIVRLIWNCRPLFQDVGDWEKLFVLSEMFLKGVVQINRFVWP